MTSDDSAGHPSGTGRKEERVELHVEVPLRKAGYHSGQAELADISSSGARVIAAERLVEGETVWLRFPGLEAIPARVAWTQEWTAGLEFQRPLHPAVLDMLLARLRR